MHRFVSADGARLHLLDFGGEGRPVVFLHGVAGNAWMWLDVAPALVGPGRARPRPRLQRLRREPVVADPGLLDEPPTLPTSPASSTPWGRPSVDLVGFSWGGLVALALAAG